MHAITPITVAIARFEDLLSRGLRGVIDSDVNLDVVAADVEVDRLKVVLRALRPRVAILDLDALPNLAEVRQLGCQNPDTRLVLLAARPTTIECAQLLAFGASACLGRNVQGRDVLTATHLASRGLQLVPRGDHEAGAGPPVGSPLLTQREADVLSLLQEGSSNAEIAAALDVGVETIRTHARNIYRKLGVSSRRELVTLPVQASLEGPGEPSSQPSRRRVTPAGGWQRRPSSSRR